MAVRQPPTTSKAHDKIVEFLEDRSEWMSVSAIQFGSKQSWLAVKRTLARLQHKGLVRSVPTTAGRMYILNKNLRV